MLTAYLAARPTAALPQGFDRFGLGWLAYIAGISFLMSFLNLSYFAFFLLLAVGLAATVFFHNRKKTPLTPEQKLARQADEVAKKLQAQASSGRLHRALHPAVGSTLEECAGYHARVLSALERWETSDLRENARLAANVAMNEALVHAGATLAFTPPARPLETVNDALEDVGFGPLLREKGTHEPMPASFRPVRELAERLRELAVRCETAPTAPHREEETPSAALGHLDAALGEMRSREEAERELRQGA